MTTLDWLVISSIALVAAYPLCVSYVHAIAGWSSGGKKGDDIEAWRQRWVASLITLGREIEAGKGGLQSKPDAQRLAKDSIRAR